MGEQQAEFAERTVDILESKIDNLQETLYKEKLNYRIRLNSLYAAYHILSVKPFKSKNCKNFTPDVRNPNLKKGWVRTLVPQT